MLKIQPTVTELLVICVKQKLQQHDMTDGPQRNIGGAGSAPTSAASPLGDLELVQKRQHHVYKAKPVHLISLEVCFELHP